MSLSRDNNNNGALEKLTKDNFLTWIERAKDHILALDCDEAEEMWEASLWAPDPDAETLRTTPPPTTARCPQATPFRRRPSKGTPQRIRPTSQGALGPHLQEDEGAPHERATAPAPSKAQLERQLYARPRPHAANLR